MNAHSREVSYGQRGLTIIDRFGVALSRHAVLKHWPSKRVSDLIDIGCGFHATLLRSLIKPAGHGVAVDWELSDDLRAIKGLESFEGDLMATLPKFTDSRFDVALLLSVLEHVPRPVELLQECHRILRPDGRLLVNVPTWRGKSFLEFSAFRLGASPACEMDDHKMYYDKRDLWPRLVEAGFRPSRIKMHYHKWGLNLFACADKG